MDDHGVVLGEVKTLTNADAALGGEPVADPDRSGGDVFVGHLEADEADAPHTRNGRTAESTGYKGSTHFL
jgi:hypothetical protein